MSADQLVNPLADGTSASAGTGTGTGSSPGVAQRWGFGSRKLVGADATKEALASVFKPAANSKPPSFWPLSRHTAWDFPWATLINKPDRAHCFARTGRVRTYKPGPLLRRERYSG